MSAVKNLDQDFVAYAERNEKGLWSETFLVEGVHCAACIQKVESALHHVPYVSHARLNFSTKRLSVEWNGTPEQANDLAAAVRDQGYGVQPYDPRAVQAESDEEERFLQRCLGVAGFAVGNIMMISVGLWASDAEVMGVETRNFLHWLSAVIAIPAVIYAGRPFYQSAWAVLKKGQTNMDVPISLGVFGAVAVSIWQLMHHGADTYFDSAAMLLFFLLVGRYLDFRARRRARGAASDLLAMMAGTAVLIQDDGTQKTVPIRELKEGMMVMIPMGQRIPADSVIVQGVSEIDTSLVTGESIPREVKEGDTIYAGTLNLSAPLKARVTSAAKDSLLSDIVRLMEKAEQGQAKYVRIADRAARLYTPFVHSLAALTLLGWLFLSDVGGAQAILIAVTVLIITCPCALGLAVPVVQVLATGRLMKRHILVKGGNALERLSTVDTVILDKTGTLTMGRPSLVNGDEISHEHMRLAVGLAAHSHHPLSKALVAAYEGGAPEFDGEINEVPGKGLEATVNGQIVRLGSAAWCGDAAQKNEDGSPEIWLQIDGQAQAVFRFRDRLRPDAKETIDKLKVLGITPVLLSGDRSDVAEAVGRELGIDEAYGGLSPVEKFERMEALKTQGHKVLMVGDGLNDAPTIAGADVSISPSSAIDMAQNAADIVFMGDKLGAIVEAYHTAVFSQKLVKENFALAILYNIIAVPLAVAGLVTPLIAAVAMSGSSLVVIANSFRLNGMKG